MATASTLGFREPLIRWMLLATVAALCLHGLGWFVMRMIGGDPMALAETQRQMGIALAWMVGALALWRIAAPPTRLHAILSILVCALFVTVLGSFGALATYFARGIMTHNLLTSFAMYGGLMVLGQLALAIPSAVVLQAVALTRRQAAG